MKQSLKAYRPVLNEPVAFSEFTGSDHSGIKMIAHCSPEYEKKKISQVYEKGKNAVILIGPEGDFTGEELVHCRQKTDLGRSIWEQAG